MAKIARRKFCGTAVLAFPLLCWRASGSEDSSEPCDAVLDALADEIARIAADGAQNGFKGEHLRRCSGVLRTFDARLEEKGANRELNRRLDEEDFQRLNPSLISQKTADYWDKHGVHLDKDDLTVRLAMDPTAYREMKKNIKKLGGVRVLHQKIAVALEQRAKEYDTGVLRKDIIVRNGRVAFSAPARSVNVQFIPAEPDLHVILGANIDCLCRAMVVEGALLALICLAGCVPCCPQSAFLLALEKLLEGLGLCNSSRC